MDYRRGALVVCAVLSVGGCVTAGSEGIQSNYIDRSVQPSERRAALTTIVQIKDGDSRYTPIGYVGGRRCHRNFLEETPSESALLPDLKVAAYGQGADAIGQIASEKVGGLAANCWYVLEGKAAIYKKK